MRKLNVSDTSWHYNIGFKGTSGKMFSSSHSGPTKSNLCPYMRHICKALGLLFCIGWFCSTIPFLAYEFFATGGSVIWTEGAFESLPILFSVWFFFGGSANLISGGIAVLIGLIGVVGWTCDTLHTKYRETHPAKVKFVDPDAPDSTWTLIDAWFSAMYNKVCPGLEIVNK